MQKKLLNKNNLIIVIVILTLFLISIPNIAFADTNLSNYLRETIAMWYYFIKYFCIAVLLILFIVVLFKGIFSNLAEDKTIFKELLPYFIVGLLLLLFLEYIIYFIIYIEQTIVDKLQTIGYDLAGISVDSEVTSLYESTRTKAYEIKFSSGMLGTLMYIVLVYYTFKFFVIYVKRYINVMILILVAPIVVLMYTYRRTIQGRGGLIGRWVKEFIYNVFIQVVHALVYSTIVAYALSLSSNALSFLGAIVAFLAFFFMFKLDGIIRKIFNFVGGKSTVQSRDYFGMVNHPVQTAKNTAGYVTQTLPGEMKNKVGKIADNLRPETIKENAIRFAHKLPYEAENLFNTIDGRDVIISVEDIEKEQKKIDDPNLPGKIFNKVQGAVLGVTSKAITGIENITQKTKEKVTDKIKKMKKAFRESRDSLNQDFEMVKRIHRILKLHFVRKGIEEKTENDEEQPIEEELEATFLNVLVSEAEEALELKLAINQEDTDMVAAVYGVYGPSVFLYKNVGSVYMGMSVLASAKYEQTYLEEYKVEDSEKKIIAFPSGQLQQDELEDDESEEYSVSTNLRATRKYKKAVKKRYTFKRFNSSSIITITRHLNRRYIMNSEYLSSLYKTGQMLASEDVQVRGSYVPHGATQIKRTSIKYTAKISSQETKENIIDLTFARQSAYSGQQEKVGEQTGQVIQFTSVRERKQQSQVILQNYHERVEDSRWAVLSGTATDIAEVQNQRIFTSVQAVRQQSASALALQQMTDIGEAVKVNDDLYVTFSDQSITETIQAMSATETRQAVMESVIIDSVIKFDVPLEEINFSENQEIQDEVITQLAQKGIISYNETQNEEQKRDVIASIEQRKEDILNNKKEYYVASVLKKTAAKTFVKAVDTGDAVVDKVTEFGDSIKNAAKNNVVINNKYTRLLGDIALESSRVLTQIAQNAIEYEAERVKQDLIDKVQDAVDVTQDYIDSAKEMYGISKEDFKLKGEQIKKDVDNLITKVGVKTEEKIKEVADKAVEPFRIFPSDDEDDDDKKEVFIFSIGGAVMAPGKYSIKLKTLKEKTGKKFFSVDSAEITVKEAINIAGGLTEFADMSAIINDKKITNRGRVYIPIKPQEYVDEEESDDEELLRECKPIVDNVIKEYMQENEIKNVATLRKLVHKKSIISKAKRQLEEKNIKTKQIEDLFEKRLKEIEFIRDSLNNVSKDMKVVDKNKLQVSEESVESDLGRQENAAKNSQEASIDAALKRLNTMSKSENADNQTEEASEENQDVLMNQLLLQLESQKEKVLITVENKQQELKTLELNGKERIRNVYIRDPDALMNKTLGRV